MHGYIQLVVMKSFSMSIVENGKMLWFARFGLVFTRKLLIKLFLSWFRRRLLQKWNKRKVRLRMMDLVLKERTMSEFLRAIYEKSRRDRKEAYVTEKNWWFCSYQLALLLNGIKQLTKYSKRWINVVQFQHACRSFLWNL